MNKIKIFFISFLIISFTACRDDISIAESEEIDTTVYSDWSDSTHSNNVEPNYSIVFKQNEVLRFDITISSKYWSAMQSDLAANLSSSSGPGGGGPGGGGVTTLSADYDPVWVPCSFKYNGKEWYNVGVRYKGNSSLQSAYQSGNKKLSLKLDFNQFGSEYPALENQRFYGFKQLNLNNNYNDASLMREKIGADLFRQFGLAASQTTFCVVYLNNGSTTQYYGVYALVEEVDDTVLDSQFTDGSGNLYKPDGDAATFASGTYDTSELYLKTNVDAGNYSDIKALYDVVNSSLRTSDVETWKSNLEKVMDVNVFLKWLAANTVIQNWDTYGKMSHNYYLYNNPSNNLLTWIPWDNNESLQEGKQSGSLSLSLSEVGTGWPLIRYLIAIDEYKQIYNGYLQQFIDEVFIPANMITTYSSYYTLLKDYVYAEQSGYSYLTSDSQFDQAVATLKTHVQSRTDAVNSYLK
ncbi:MAG: CotH kinase family protein [Paludibacter sp.]|nr:CotH kinase family protein [Paludibacter sp.]